MGVWGKTMGGDVRLITNSVVCMKTGGESARLFCSEFFLSIKNRCNLGNVFDAYIQSVFLLTCALLKTTFPFVSIFFTSSTSLCVAATVSILFVIVAQIVFLFSGCRITACNISMFANPSLVSIYHYIFIYR